MPRPDPATTEETTQRSGTSLAAAVIAVTMWGLVPVALRYFVSSLDPITFSVIRFGASGAGALPFFIVAKPWRWPPADIVRLLFSAAFAVPGLNLPAAFAVKTLPAGVLGLVTATEPIFIILFSLLATRSGVSPRVVLGGLIALLGVLLTQSRSAEVLTGGENLGGIAWGLAGAASWGIYSVIGAPLARRHGSFGMTGGVLVFGGLVVSLALAPTVPLGTWPSPRVFTEIGALGLTTSVAGFLLWNHAAGRIRPAPLGLFLYLIPLVAVLSGAALLGEALSLRMIMGGLVIIGGVAIGEGRGRATLDRLLQIAGRPA